MKFRFYLALWAGKLVTWFNRICGKTRRDVAGVVMYKICPEFLKYVAKPKITIVVTGTNGKTSVTAMIRGALKADGLSVEYNDWGANLKAGHCLLLSRAVTPLNRPRVDAAVIEADEVTLPDTVPMISPDYLVITNICRDSIRRNGHPLNIKEKLQQTVDLLSETIVILNADDPISGLIRVPRERAVYIAIGMEPGGPIREYNNNDFAVCPVCGAEPAYRYKHYLQIGKYYCPKCGFTAPEPDFFAERFDREGKSLTVREPEGSVHTYPISSSSIFNAFNYLSVIAVLRKCGFDPENVQKMLHEAKLPPSRETEKEVGGIRVHTVLCKGQTGSSESVLLETLAGMETNVEIVLMVNEQYEEGLDAHETITWIYDVDYEFLRGSHIRKILMGGPLYADYLFRFRMADLPEEQFECLTDESRLIDAVVIDGIDDIFILHEVNCVTKARKFRNELIRRIEDRKGLPHQTNEEEGIWR